MSPVPKLSVRGLVKRFGGLVAVSGLSFDVAPREVIGLIGPNGSGKTTVLNLISGALAPSAGSISLDGRALSGRPAHQIARRGVSRTFQLVRVLPGLSLLDNVNAGAVFGHVRRWDDESNRFSMALLERVGLGGRQDASVESLTYIDSKRLELARALASEPELLLLDEWLAGLNPSELETGINLIASLRAEGRTVILVEHVMDAIRSLCDRCVVMNAGTLIAEGRPDAVLSERSVIEAYLGED